MRPAYVQSSSATLGTFHPTPYVMIGGDYPTASAGYSPLEIYGDTTLPLYGPMSAFRVSTAPVLDLYPGLRRPDPRDRGEFIFLSQSSVAVAGRLSDRVELLLGTADAPNTSLGVQRHQLDRSELTF